MLVTLQYTVLSRLTLRSSARVSGLGVVVATHTKQTDI